MISTEQTVRLGAAHGDEKYIGLLFSTPQKERISLEPPPLSHDFSQEPDIDMAEPEQAELQKNTRPPANWLDAIYADHQSSASDERDSAFHSDDNGLYRMYLPETV